MTNHQPVYRDDEPLTQSQAARAMGVRRGVVRHMLEMQQIEPVDHEGPRGAPRISYAEAMRAKAVREAELPRRPAQDPLPGGELSCRGCSSWRARALAAEEGERRAKSAMDLAMDAALRAGVKARLG